MYKFITLLQIVGGCTSRIGALTGGAGSRLKQAAQEGGAARRCRNVAQTGCCWQVTWRGKCGEADAERQTRRGGAGGSGST